MTGDAVLIARDVRVAVGRLARRLRRIYGQGQAPGESSFLELAVLLRVERTGPSSASALATGERVTSQAVSVALAGLRRRGLVRVTTDPSDRRRSLIEISDAGRETLERRERQVGDRLADVVTSNFSDAELECLRAAAPLLNRIADLL
jgi:DNA-binding MarR family transcriptional regulator